MPRIIGLMLVSVVLLAGCGAARPAGVLSAPTSLPTIASAVPSAVPQTTGPSTGPSVTSGASAGQSGFRDPAQPVCRLNADGTEAFSFGAAAPARLPVDFMVTSVDWCADATVSRGGDTVAVLEHRQATGDVSTFVADLRGPDGPPAPSDGAGCEMYADTRPELVVTDPTGRVFAPRYPQDYCGHNYGNAARDFRQLTYRVVSQQDVGVVDSQIAQKSGCSYRYKSLSELYATNEIPPTAGGPVVSGGLPAPITECDYDRGSDGIGTLTAGTALGAARTESLQLALTTLPAAAPCSVNAPQFVLLMAHGDSVIIERGGCDRVAGNDDKLHAGDAAVTAALALPSS